MSERRAWSLLTIANDRQYGGNTGYDDDPSSIYRYDSDVANHLQLQVGDIVILRTRTEVIGIAEIGSIDEDTAQKDRLRCPTCRVTNIKRRSKTPSWRCKSGHVFETPITESASVTTYAARYGATFVSCPQEMTVTRLHNAVLRPSDQMSIKEVNLSQLERFLGGEAGINALIKRFVQHIDVPEGAATVTDNGPGTMIDRRRRIMREIALRRGQAKFRTRLIRRYGARCQISDCHFAGLVEAAHIRPYAATEDNGAQNGLLLRSDLHTLFDLGLLGIEPHTLRIKLHPALHLAGYAEFEDRRLFVNNTSGPSNDALNERWVFFTEKLKDDCHGKD